MKMIIFGSGGFLPTPLPLCTCRFCKESPEKRVGPSIYIPGLELLIDTPEGIYNNITEYKSPISNVLYSHWHPDHTAGIRLFEFLHYTIRSGKKRPRVFMNDLLLKSFQERVPSLIYYKNKKFIDITKVKESKFILNDVKIYFIEMRNDFSVAYLIETPNKNILICMDHAKDLILENINVKIDLLIMNLGFVDVKKGEHVRSEKTDETNFIEDNLRIIQHLKPSKTVLMHIEPLYNLNKRDLQEIERKYARYNLAFAYDGMVLFSE